MIVIEIVVVEGFECVKEVLSRGVNFNLLPARDLWKFVALKILPDSLYHLQLHKLHVQTAICCVALFASRSNSDSDTTVSSSRYCMLGVQMLYRGQFR